MKCQATGRPSSKYAALSLWFAVLAFHAMSVYAQFGEERLISVSSQLGFVGEVHAADFNGDGDLDLLATAAIFDNSQEPSTIAWYENLDGFSSFGQEQRIEARLTNRLNVKPADLDGDGDEDLVVTGTSTDLVDGRTISKTIWLENLDGLGTFGEEMVINENPEFPIQSFETADVDSDGDLDVIGSYSYGAYIVWYENTDGSGTFDARHFISNTRGAELLRAQDLDGDGDVDLLATSSQIVWYENTDGSGNFGAPHLINDVGGPIHDVGVSDLDGDEDLDVLASSTLLLEDKIAWYENTDGLGTFGPEQVVTVEVDELAALPIHIADLDGDGDQDVLSASDLDEKIAWYENTDGQGTFGPQKVITALPNRVLGPRDILAADLDEDGDQDVVALAEGPIQLAWFENLDGKGSFSIPWNVLIDAEGISSSQAADLDGDGDLDVLVGSGDKVSWYKNADGLGTFDPQRVIRHDIYGSRDVFAADLDGDGDQDVLACSGNGVAWFENTDGFGSFRPQQVITDDARWAWAVFAADLDGDGDQDVLSASHRDDKIAWYENTDGRGTFGTQQIISTDVLDPSSVQAADLDGDGDQDVLATSSGDGTILWFQNMDGQGAFSLPKIINTSADRADDVQAVDLDGDTDLDVLFGSTGDDKVAWHENMDGEGTFGSERVITLEATNNFQVVTAADFDGDGDQDVLSSAFTGTVFPGIAWYENLDGRGTFGSAQIIFTWANIVALQGADFDRDGDQDVLAAYGGSRVAWFENNTITVAIERDQQEHSERTALEQNYPNPVNLSTTIPFSISDPTHVTLQIYDVLGREVATLVSQTLPAGSHSVRWDTVNRPGGVYFYRLQAASFVQTHTLVLVK